MDAPIIEIFSSIQGEGLLIGERQIFVRFAGDHSIRLQVSYHWQRPHGAHCVQSHVPHANRPQWGGKGVFATRNRTGYFR